MIALFLQKGLVNPDFARKLLGGEHSGFSIESGTRIWDQDSREALCQYIVRAPLSLQSIRWNEQQHTVTWTSSPSGYFRGRQRRFSSMDFIAQLTLHIPSWGRHLVRRYGLYSSLGRQPVAQQTAGGQGSRNREGPSDSQLTRARQLVGSEDSWRSRAPACPEGSGGSTHAPAGKPGHGCWQRSTSLM